VRRILFILLENSPSSEQNDFLSWLIDESQGEDREDWPIAARIFNLNFAAIHTSSMVSLPKSSCKHELICGSGRNARLT
jgi:hypothetical protein